MVRPPTAADQHFDCRINGLNSATASFITSKAVVSIQHIPTTWGLFSLDQSFSILFALSIFIEFVFIYINTSNHRRHIFQHYCQLNMAIIVFFIPDNDHENYGDNPAISQHISKSTSF
jgi:hypothetical protein